MWPKFLQPPEVSEHPRVIEADQWASDFEPEPGYCYGEALAYAKDKYAYVQKVFDTLDAKADRLFQIAIALAGVLGLSNLIGAHPVAWYGKVASYAGLAFFLTSMILAVLVRMPRSGGCPPESHQVLLSAGKDEHDLRARMAACFHAATVATEVITAWKADVLTWASWILCGGVFLAVLGLLAN